MYWRYIEFKYYIIMEKNVFMVQLNKYISKISMENERRDIN